VKGIHLEQYSQPGILSSHITHSSNFGQFIALQAQLSIVCTNMAPIYSALIPRDLPGDLEAFYETLLDIVRENKKKRYQAADGDSDH